MFGKNRISCAVGALALAMTAATAFASSDALIDALEKKGLLTSREAADLKEQTYNETREMFPGTKIVLGSWLDELKIYGDARVRYESFFNQKLVRLDGLGGGATAVAPRYAKIQERNRFRYRLRLGMKATAGDFQATLRLASGENQGGANGNGDPISTNSTFDITDSKKPVYIDQANIAWNPSSLSEVTFVGGKMENPFYYSPMTFDGDWTPEGFAEVVVVPIDSELELFFTAAQIAIEERSRGTGQMASGNAHDIFLFGEQFGADWKIIDKTLGWKPAVALYSFDGLNRAPITLPSAGNPLHGVSGTAGAAVREAMNTVVFNNQVSVGIIDGLPITIYGDYMQNLANSDQGNDGMNTGWYVGIKLGKAKKKGQWEIGYWYEELGANAFLDAVTDSDFGYGGTNNKGHIIKTVYAITDFFTLGGSLWIIENMDNFVANAPNVPGGAVANGGDQRHSVMRLQMDAVMKF